MKIDEHISLCRVCAKDLRDTAKRMNNAQMKEDAKEWDEAADMFEELQWYKEQDLVTKATAREIWEDSLGMVIKYHCCSIDELFEKIPKAEPPFAKDTNVPDNGGDEDAD